MRMGISRRTDDRNDVRRLAHTRGKGLLLGGKLWPKSEQNTLNTAYRSD